MKSLTNLPVISRLSDTVIRILGCNPGIMTLQGTNTYLVGTGTRRILIDAGEAKTAKEYTKVLRQVLEEEKATIEHLMITHWHHDHLGGAKSVQNLLRTMNPTYHSTTWKLPRAPEDKGKKSQAEQNISWQDLEDKQVVEVEGAKVRVEYTPGHSSDHASLVLEDENIICCGDCVLGEGTAIFEDLLTYMDSLKKIMAMKPKLMYPGHGPVIEDPETVIKYYIEHRLRRENEILGVIQETAKNKAISEMDIVKHMYMGTSKIMWEVAAYNVERHLDKLLKEGKVKGEKGKWQSV
ncbi:Beta-lactamase-like protein 2 [Habropoda laboriosa]|uniref:Beta-lactamase-like protein 2 homolog n=1 Tax=Habropoda laboriosa TaxID=597456 RepID=A0A0L7QVZ3_9HYME|nr:PREDICTED: beta-lactamase-like protein 2 [Habropoda laboriosa]KOC62726.1 Beta-lactamase-like protein 2 [Habropoda laboriosa]